MIFGIGTDIVSTRRIAELHARYADKLAQRLLATDEWREYTEAANKHTLLAKRFAAKEAFAKAAGTGMRGPVHFGAIRVTHDALGRPGLAFTSELEGWLRARGIGTAHLSLSDEQDYAVAFVTLEHLERA